MRPEIGQKVYDGNGQEWEVYLTKLLVPCVRLIRWNGKSNEYKDIPVNEFEIM